MRAIKCSSYLFFTDTFSLSVSKLIIQEEYVIRLMGKGRTVNLAYHDFAKAFDSVNHRFLLAKLKSSGVDGPELNWIKYHLSNPTFQVRLKDST